MSITTIDENLLKAIEQQKDRQRDEAEPESERFSMPIAREDNKRLSQINFEPLGNWCLLKEIDAAIETSGLIIPEAYGQTFRKGIVCCTGKGTIFGTGAFIECTVDVGDVVLFGKAAGIDVTLSEGPFKLVRESECFGKVPGKK